MKIQAIRKGFTWTWVVWGRLEAAASKRRCSEGKFIADWQHFPSDSKLTPFRSFLSPEFSTFAHIWQPLSEFKITPEMSGSRVTKIPATGSFWSTSGGQDRLLLAEDSSILLAKTSLSSLAELGSTRARNSAGELFPDDIPGNWQSTRSSSASSLSRPRALMGHRFYLSLEAILTWLLVSLGRY